MSLGAARRRIGVPAAVAAVVMVPFLLFGETPVPDAGSSAAIFVLFSIALLGLDPVLPVPSTVVLVALGARFGTLTGATVGTVGLVAGTAVALGIGRLAARPLGYPLAGEAMIRRLAWSDPVAVALTRAVPIVSETTAILAGIRRAPVARTLAAGAVAAAALATISSVFGSAGRADHPAWAVVGAVLVPVTAGAALLLAGRRASGLQKV